MRGVTNVVVCSWVEHHINGIPEVKSAECESWDEPNLNVIGSQSYRSEQNP